MKRTCILAAGAVLHLCLGTIYAFSFFQKPLMATYGWTNGQTAGVFSLAILFLGLAAAVGGPLLRRTGPRPLAAAGALLYAGAWLAGSWALAHRNLPLFQVLFGVMGGIGLGLAYVTPVATVAKWFPHKNGFAAGIVVMGFGLGALFMSKLLAPQFWRITGGSLPDVFRLTGWLLLAVSLPAALLLADPPAPAADASPAGAVPAAPPPVSDTFPSWSFAWVWLVFFCNITAGIIFIGFQSPLLQDGLAARNPRLTTAELATAGATLIAASAVCNGLGRSLWGALSDRLGGLATFRILLGAQLAVFLLLTVAGHPAVLFVGVCAVLLCYGGGFGAMPLLIAERYGPSALPRAYGAVLTAWGAAGVAGPQLAAFLRDRAAGRAVLFGLAALILALGLAATGGLRRHRRLGTTPFRPPAGLSRRRQSSDKEGVETKDGDERGNDDVASPRAVAFAKTPFFRPHVSF
jgi:OFA family oxalate/formate antiporter-like MFS transporter